jgi:hypothetical protein
LQQVFASLTFPALCLGKGLAKLAFENTVNPANFLLFAQLLSITGQTLAGFLTVLAGRVRTTLDRTLVGKTLLAFEKELLSFTATLAALGVEIAGHLSDSP